MAAPLPARAASLPPPLRSDPRPGLGAGALHALYDLAWIAAVWVALAARGRRARTRRMLLERCGRGLPSLGPPAGARVLLHGVSVGEVKGLLPLARGLAERHPRAELVLSATTDTGLEVARGSFAGRALVRYPFDHSRLVRRFLARVQPTLVVLFELELWPAFLRECNRRGIPVVVVNGRITERSRRRFRALGRFAPLLERVSFLCAQSEEHAARFRDLGVEPARLRVTGNVKFDGLRSGPVDPGEELRRLLGASDGRLVVVGGSTHAPEEELLVRAWRAAIPGARLVLVPRHPERSRELVARLSAAGPAPQLLGALRAGEPPDPARPAIVDTVGELERVYGLADLAYVGGSLTPERGGQNVLEPAALGRPVLHGPWTQSFAQEVRLLAAAGASREVADEAALARALAELAADPAARARMGAAGAAALAGQRGATERTLEALETLLAGA